MRFNVLGPLQVADEIASVPLGGPKQRLVLAHLVLSANRVVPADRLIDAVWGDRLPEEPRPALQVSVSRLRSVLGSDTIEGRPPGYLLHVDPDDVDALRFEAFLAASRARSDPAIVAGILAEALGLWRGPALADLALEPSLVGEIARLDELRLQAIEEKVAAQLELGHDAEVVAEVEALARAHPGRERLWIALILALYRLDRQADALAAFERARVGLADQLGIDPSAELRRLHERILRQDPDLGTEGTIGGYREVVASADVSAAPRTHYAATADGLHIAYAVTGSGPDLVVAFGFVSNIEYLWEWPLLADFWRRLASFSRLIVFDKRGTGLSDAVPDDQLPNLETRMDDVRAVMDAAGSDQATVFGISEGAAVSIMFAATHPERCSGLVLYGGYACEIKDADHPWGWVTREEKEHELELIERGWGTTEYAAWILRSWGAPTYADDPRFQEAWATWMRRSASPGAALVLERMNSEIDVTGVLPAVRVPTLILHRDGDQPELARHLAARIPGAEYVELSGRDHIPFVGDVDAIVEEVERFVRSSERTTPELDRVLATVLFVDVAEPLDGAGRQRLREDRAGDVHRLLARYRGRRVETTGATVVARFDGPARAVRCAEALVDALGARGIPLRAGVHVGEIEARANEMGDAVFATGAAVCALAGVRQVLVTQTVTELVAGSGLDFEGAGRHRVDGVPSEMELYRVVGLR